MAGVLNDIKVLDLSWGISGPLVGMLLGDHGADVTRIERPQGDPFKGMLGYKVWHRGKKNAIFDLKNGFLVKNCVYKLLQWSGSPNFEGMRICILLNAFGS